ncbi:hypothetical protein M9H77_32410 [Catharanthus roseus]|uniref:Uncharacterized protein n=1 Tax=Catharanthus roseus TaxID=4058 RepID=A0ACC0A729_CATRO|nr:hypothetical protein M9H77_32410 [Catharanthus roseus]
MKDCGLNGMTQSIRPSVSRPQKAGLMDEVVRVLESIRRVLAHSLIVIFSVGCSRLTSLMTSFTKTFIFIREGMRRRDKFCKLKEQKEHKRRSTSLNEGLKKGHAYGFGTAESVCLCAQSQHATVGSLPFVGCYEKYMVPSVARSLMR